MQVIQSLGRKNMRIKQSSSRLIGKSSQGLFHDKVCSIFVSSKLDNRFQPLGEPGFPPSYRFRTMYFLFIFLTDDYLRFLFFQKHYGLT